MASQAAETVAHQLGNGQREPSMEEILASIRRIIEDSDTGRSAADATIPEAANISSPPMGAADMETFREEFRGSVDPEAKVPGPDVPTVDAPRAADPVVAPPSEPAPRIERKLQTARVEPAETGMTKDWKQRLASPVAEVVPAAAPAVAEEPTEATLPPTGLVDPQRQAILSDVAGRQVAAAFGELSDVFAASRRRSFDEVAEDMLRPMLQDWLDNNLPTLVERLVREEIERVARGGTR